MPTNFSLFFGKLDIYWLYVTSVFHVGSCVDFWKSYSYLILNKFLHNTFCFLFQGGLTATDVFAVEWIQTNTIHYGLTVSYYGFVSDGKSMQCIEYSEKLYMRMIFLM